MQAVLGILKCLDDDSLQIWAKRSFHGQLQARRSNTKLRNRTKQASDLSGWRAQECAYAITIATQALPPVFEHIEAISNATSLSFCFHQGSFQTLDLLLGIGDSACHGLFTLRHL